MKQPFVTLLLVGALVYTVSGCVSVCSEAQTCEDCSCNPDCFFCSSNKVNIGTNETSYCVHIRHIPGLAQNCTAGFCQDAGCYCEPAWRTIWPYSDNYVGQFLLMAFYGAILAFGAKMIADGSEMLLEILDPGIIGGLLLPILGAVPDSAMIIISGVSGKQCVIQNQLQIGMGTLAGSTVMLLTVPWSASMWLARCDIRTGEAIDKKLTRPVWGNASMNLHNTGITVDNDTPWNARMALLTSLSYWLVQIPAFFYVDDPQSGKDLVKWFALGGSIVCVGFLSAYCAYQVLNPKMQKRKIEKARKEAILRSTLQKFVARMKHTQEDVQDDDADGGEGHSLLAQSLINQHDDDEPDLRAVGLKWKTAAQKKAEDSMDYDAETIGGEESDSEDEEEYDGEKPKWRILLESMTFMLLGTFLVFVFSDPMVDVLQDFADKAGIKSFYVSFVVTPFCSNASELISSLIFASKKKKRNSSLTYSALYGACIMNNTMCLGIFFALIFFQDLAWTFAAETLGCLLCVYVVCSIGSVMTTFRTWMAVLIALMYPIAFGLTVLLESVGLDGPPPDSCPNTS